MFLSIFRKYNIQCLAIRALLFRRCFAKLEDIGVVHVSDDLLRFLAELVDLLRLFEVLKEGFFVRVVLEFLDQLFDIVFTMCILLFNCRERYTRNSVIHGVAPGLPGHCLIRLVGHKMFLHPVHVDLVDQFASSILAQPAVLSESSVPFGIAHPSSSCIPLSRCKQLVVCRSGRLHATLFGKTAILSLE